MNTEEREKFLTNINSIPVWVKNTSDLITFCKHINYRLNESDALLKFYQRNFKFNDEQLVQFYNILDSYESAYNEDKNTQLHLKFA